MGHQALYLVSISTSPERAVSKTICQRETSLRQQRVELCKFNFPLDDSSHIAAFLFFVPCSFFLFFPFFQQGSAESVKFLSYRTPFEALENDPFYQQVKEEDVEEYCEKTSDDTPEKGFKPVTTEQEMEVSMNLKNLKNYSLLLPLFSFLFFSTDGHFCGGRCR